MELAGACKGKLLRYGALSGWARSGLELLESVLLPLEQHGAIGACTTKGTSDRAQHRQGTGWDLRDVVTIVSSINYEYY